MKKIAAAVIAAVFIAAGILIFPSCSRETVDVEKILAYQAQTSYNDVEFSVGKSRYNMNVSLGALTGEYPLRDGAVLMSSGALDGMLFEMQGGELKLKTGDFEMQINEKDSPAMFALFGAFSIEPSQFTGITQSESESDKLTARFGGKYKFELTLNEVGEVPEIIKVETGKDTYTVCLKADKTQEISGE